MKLLFSLFLALFVSATAALAEEVAPDALVKGVTTDVLAIVHQDKELQNGNSKRVIELVETKVLPHFDFSHMAALALGREWKKASPEQKKRLTEEFRALLVRTYSNALTAYKNQTVVYKPFKLQPGETDVVVKTEVRQQGAQAIPLDYSLEKQGDSWKVYDVIVGGISLVTNYRESFAQEVRGGGIDGLIQSIASKNRQLEIGKK